MSLYLRHTASNYNLLYQPMNWLATHIPSLRDFYTCLRHLTRRNSALTRPAGALHGASAPLHARRALHGTTCPYLVPAGLSPPPFPLLSQLRASASQLRASASPLDPQGRFCSEAEKEPAPQAPLNYVIVWKMMLRFQA